MKLRMDHGARKRNHAPLATIHAPGDDAAKGPMLDRRRHPLPFPADRALAQLRAGELADTSLGQTVPINLPKTPPAHEEDPAAIRMNAPRKRTNLQPVP